MTLEFKRVVFDVWTDTPGWFVDEAFKKGLMVTSVPYFMCNYKCNVTVFGLKDKMISFMSYVKEQDFDVEVIEEHDELKERA